MRKRFSAIEMKDNLNYTYKKNKDIIVRKTLGSNIWREEQFLIPGRHAVKGFKASETLVRQQEKIYAVSFQIMLFRFLQQMFS